MKYSIIIITVAILLIFGCKDKNSNPLWDSDCPFAGLEFTSVIEHDSISKTIEFNDSLIASLQSDLNNLKSKGKIGNNLSSTINNFKSNTSTKKIIIDDPDYEKWILDKTKTLCGLHGQLSKSNIYTSSSTRQQAEILMLNLISDLKTYEPKKISQKTKTVGADYHNKVEGDVVISNNQSGGITAHTVVIPQDKEVDLKDNYLISEFKLGPSWEENRKGIQIRPKQGEWGRPFIAILSTELKEVAPRFGTLGGLKNNREGFIWGKNANSDSIQLKFFIYEGGSASPSHGYLFTYVEKPTKFVFGDWDNPQKHYIYTFKDR